MSEQETREKIKEIAQKIAVEFKPEKIILFGSYAWGKPDPDSDVDLFVIKEVENTRGWAGKIRMALWDYPIAMDILVYNKERLGRSLKKQNFFIKDIISQGQVLYER
ncbi:MAG: nucleotidyltransferase domain-containing protein [Patescibacteria group bacterium]|nr:nucleotidyltransferase domain-containing protein [Patescibacteria group bacterium]